MPSKEHHYSQRSPWLRAAVLGANDGIVSTASLLLGVAAAGTAHTALILTGLAGLIAGAMSMAAGEYVSVSSQADAEAADLQRERESLQDNAPSELAELIQIYVDRGLDRGLATTVATQLMERDALSAHARDELGLSELHAARPLQAALASAFTFAFGAALPLLVALLAPTSLLTPLIAGSSLLTLATLGALAAYAGGAKPMRGLLRVTFWGALAMAVTSGIGALFGFVV